MLRLSKKADYALLALQRLASEGAAGSSARAIAERFCIPVELLAKILQQLARTGLVAADRGVHGGYRLTRPAHTISVAEIVQAIDGPMTLTACSPRDVACQQFATCTVREPLSLVRERILSVLHDVTLADIGDAESHAVPLTIRRQTEATAILVQRR